MNINEIKDIPAEKFVLVQQDSSLHDLKFDTKPIGYFKDAWIRFRKNKGSVVAACIITLLLAFAIFVPIFSKYDAEYIDGYYSHVLPKSELLSKIGIWDGVSSITQNQQGYDYLKGIPGAIVELKKQYDAPGNNNSNAKFYDMKVDSYKKVGYVYVGLTKTEFDSLVQYQEDNDVKIMFPMIDTKKVANPGFLRDANYWYKHNMKGIAEYDENGDFINIFKKDETSPDGYSYYKSKMGGSQYQVRVLYYEYYKYVNGHHPSFIFGCDNFGKDIMVRLAGGARVSFLLGIFVSFINICIGAVYGSIEGYYGGYVDLIMERFSEIIMNIPMIISVSLFQIYFAKKVGPLVSLMFAFILTGWIGPAYRMRTQFYRFKGQEYVLAARTLGAKDNRLIFKHILPNSLGTFITSTILLIPGVIFGESTLSYLGIVDLQTSGMTSVGTLLNNAKASLSSFPHELFFPAAFISLLMISFNLFGNGLRDAFNPSLRGSEE
ncbi:ABC transporter permease [Sedimentibacter sp. zth1]|uniref:ABC transporter permease n=1 Tax=Sedimentibacter sp. zth1 TaxID=2816908 RepID=UPI001A919AB1|nr:ABC transporter permease [Sedimentibacter sp. zth1]QSX06851.1 ABC transporter permease [Sedimentibacter sp. zth1]